MVTLLTITYRRMNSTVAKRWLACRFLRSEVCGWSRRPTCCHVEPRGKLDLAEKARRSMHLPPWESGCPGPSVAWHVSIHVLPPIKLVQEEDRRETRISILHIVFGLPCLHDVSVFLMFTIQLALAILNPGFGNQSGGGRSWYITRTGAWAGYLPSWCLGCCHWKMDH